MKCKCYVFIYIKDYIWVIRLASLARDPSFTMKYCFKHIVFTYIVMAQKCALMTAHFPNLGKSRVVLAINDRNLFFSCGWAILRAHKNSPKVHPEPLTLALSSSRRRFGLGLWLCGQVPTRLGSLLVWAHSSRKDCSCPSQFIISTRSSHTGLSDIAGMSHKTIGATSGPTYTHTPKKTLMLCGRSHSLHMIHKDTLFPWPVHDWWSYIYISLSLSIYLSFCLSTYLSFYWSICLYN